MSSYEKIAAASPVKTDQPHAWIQWKGTNVCADIHCSCGALGHVDAEFAYTVRCSNCGRLWGMDPSVTLVPLTEDDVKDGVAPCATEPDKDTPVTYVPPSPF